MKLYLLVDRYMRNYLFFQLGSVQFVHKTGQEPYDWHAIRTCKVRVLFQTFDFSNFQCCEVSRAPGKLMGIIKIIFAIRRKLLPLHMIIHNTSLKPHLSSLKSHLLFKWKVAGCCQHPTNTNTSKQRQRQHPSGHPRRPLAPQWWPSLTTTHHGLMNTSPPIFSTSQRVCGDVFMKQHGITTTLCVMDGSVVGESGCFAHHSLEEYITTDLQHKLEVEGQW